MRAQYVLETCLYVDDLAAAEDFYRRVLSLEFLSRVDGRHVFFRCGRGVVLLFNPKATRQPGGALPVPAHGAFGPGHAAFAMAPDEVEAWRQHLSDQQVAIEQEITWPSGGRSLYFRDPAGNSLELATSQTWGRSEPPASD